jgi:biopolymer transport protein ExbB
VCAAAIWHAELRAQPEVTPPVATAPVAPGEKPAENVVLDKTGESVTEAPAGEEQLPAKKKSRSLGEMLWNGGEPVGLSFYGVLALFSVAALTVGLERLVNLRRGTVAPPKFVKALRELLIHQDGTAESFRRVCETSDSPISRILRAALLRSGRPLVEVEKAMEDALAREQATLRARNRPLSVLANVAPLVGLLGTVVGMIMSFLTASTEGLGQGEKLAEGISLALLTTAGGLMIAIPSVLMLAWLSARVERYMREIDECLMETMPSFGRMEGTRGLVASNGDSHTSLRDEPVAAGKEG